MSQMPRLSQTLFYPPDVCQQCGCGELFDSRSLTSFWHDATVGPLQRWQEHDERDQPERVLVILCEACAGEVIEPHPRLYRLLQEHEPWPGCMPLCRDCIHRNDVACEHPNAKVNGGPGIELTFPKPMVAFLDGARGGWREVQYLGPVRHCAGKATGSEQQQPDQEESHHGG